MTDPTMGAERRRLAVGIASETMGELVEFWGFKASMGRIWTTLYLSHRPLPADEIAERTQLSAGAVSMTLSELMQWGLIHRVPMAGERKRHYRADTDVWALIRRIFRERELRLVGRAGARRPGVPLQVRPGGEDRHRWPPPWRQGQRQDRRSA